MAPKGTRSGRQARKAWASRRVDDGADGRAFNKPAIGADPAGSASCEPSCRRNKWIRKEEVGPGVKPVPKPSKQSVRGEGSLVAALERATSRWQPAPCAECGAVVDRVWDAECRLCEALHSSDAPATEVDAALVLKSLADGKRRHPSLMMVGDEGMFEAIRGTQSGYYARMGIALVGGKWVVLKRTAKELPQIVRPAAPEAEKEDLPEPPQDLQVVPAEEAELEGPEEVQPEPLPEEQPAGAPEGEPAEPEGKNPGEPDQAEPAGVENAEPEEPAQPERRQQEAGPNPRHYWLAAIGGKASFRTHTAEILPRHCALPPPADEVVAVNLQPWWCAPDPPKPIPADPKRIAEIRQWKKSWSTIALGFGWEAPPFANYPGVVAKWYQGRSEIGPDAAHVRMGDLGFFGRLQVRVGCLGAVGAALVEARREVMDKVPINKSTILYRRIGTVDRSVRGKGEVAGAIPLLSLGQIQTSTGVFVVSKVRRIYANGAEYECAGLQLVKASLRLLQNPVRKVCDWATAGVMTNAWVGSQTMTSLSVRGAYVADSRGQAPGKLESVRVDMNLLRCNKSTPEHLRGIMADLVSSVSALPPEQMEKVVPLRMAEWVYERDQAVREACGDYVPFSLRA